MWWDHESGCRSKSNCTQHFAAKHEKTSKTKLRRFVGTVAQLGLKGFPLLSFSSLIGSKWAWDWRLFKQTRAFLEPSQVKQT